MRESYKLYNDIFLHSVHFLKKQEKPLKKYRLFPLAQQ